LSSADTALATFPSHFFWGLATAPAQSEDQLEDDWVQFARDGHVASWKNTPHPEDRLRFWTQPDVEIDLAVKANVQVLRMGVDWFRLFPGPELFNASAMGRYVEICQKVKAAGLQVMLTLFHHSLPPWAHRMGGWTTSRIQPLFQEFYGQVVMHLGQYVDYWVTFNEPHVYAGLTYCVGLWPPGKNASTISQLECIVPSIGDYDKALKEMADAHNSFVQHCRKMENCRGSIGVAHNVANYVAHRAVDVPFVKVMTPKAWFGFIDDIKENLDFLGLNYYSREIIHGTNPILLDDWEYSESGRCVDPDGLYIVLKAFWDRYSAYIKRGIIITENGISDATDILRPSYLMEHLLAIEYAMKQGINVSGYIQWTISDNWEWADGYCPKFGLVAVNRSSQDFDRLPRPSFNLYSTIAATSVVTERQRNDAWAQVKESQDSAATRPFCRAADGVHGNDVPVPRPFAKRDWRFSGVSDVEVII